MKFTSQFLILLAFLFNLQICKAFAAGPIYSSYLWHVHQPIYWPDRGPNGDHYENAWDTIRAQDAGRNHPSPENLRTIFGLDDRVGAYQWRMADAVNGMMSLPNAGAQISYSGALIENVQSLGVANQLGYHQGWHSSNRNSKAQNTSAGKTRMDFVNFTYHHSLAPLLSDETLEMELKIQQRQMEIFWGNANGRSKGFFPTEMSFSERMIPLLKKLGIDWAIVSNNHISRATKDFPLVLGSGGENCDIPNLADQLNPAQGKENYKKLSIERGVSPTAPVPFGYRPHYSQFVNPTTGKIEKLIVVPSDQALSWRDSYGNWDLNLLNEIKAKSDPAHPAFVVLAHDGDNGWSGGYSYYNEWVQNYVHQARNNNVEATTVEQYLVQYPLDANDVIHVEDGPWSFADGDFGSPTFINWHWPPSYKGPKGNNIVDPSLGVTDKGDVWRVIVATENRVKTAEQMSGTTPRVDQVRDPGSFSTPANQIELGWHYYLAGLDSGFVYYGCHDDECLRPVKAQENAARNVDPIISNIGSTNDKTPPTLFIPQRHPYNPGGRNFGVQYGYREYKAANTDFFVWTYGYDVSGISSATLYYRVNGTNAPSITETQFATYAGGDKTGKWMAVNMNTRNPDSVLGVQPKYIASYYWTKVTGVSNSYVDYYIEAKDVNGNAVKTPIQHVYVGQGMTN